MAARILIVEDQHAFMLRELLDLYGQFEYDLASDGLTAIKKLAGPLPDLVLLDLRLPGIGGMAVLDAIRKVASCLPVIIVTAYGDKGTRQEAVARGADGFFQKPVNAAKLHRHINTLLAMNAIPQVGVETLILQGEQAQQIALQRRLLKLKERKALLGIDSPPELLIEIEDLEGEIKNAESLFEPPRKN